MSDQNQKLVLLAEDDAAVRKLAAALLSGEHFHVLEADGAEEALRLAGAHDDIDLLLTDVEMGAGLNGFDLGSQIAGEHPAVRVLVMSGFLENQSTAARRGFPFLPKPFTPSTLIERVADALASRLPAQSETRPVTRDRLSLAR